MKKYLYAYFNVLTCIFAPVQTSDIKPEDYPDHFKEALTSVEPKYLKTFLEDDLYYLGSYDSVTGEIFPAKEFVLHCGDLATLILEKRKANEDGKEPVC